LRLLVTVYSWPFPISRQDDRLLFGAMSSRTRIISFFKRAGTAAEAHRRLVAKDGPAAPSYQWVARVVKDYKYAKELADQVGSPRAITHMWVIVPDRRQSPHKRKAGSWHPPGLENTPRRNTGGWFPIGEPIKNKCTILPDPPKPKPQSPVIPKEHVLSGAPTDIQQWVAEAIEAQATPEKPFVSGAKVMQYLLDYNSSLRPTAVAKLVTNALAVMANDNLVTAKKNAYALLDPGRARLLPGGVPKRTKVDRQTVWPEA
jgi:hypothetical protein